MCEEQIRRASKKAEAAERVGSIFAASVALICNRAINCGINL